MSTNHHESTRKEFLTSAAAAAAGVAAIGSLGFTRPALAAHHEGSDAKAEAPITQVVSFTVQEGKIEAAHEALTKMVNAVKETEPGVLAYIAHQSKKDANTVVFFEVYKDMEAMKVHNTTPQMTELRSRFMELFTPPLDIHLLDRIEGFAR